MPLKPLNVGHEYSEQEQYARRKRLRAIRLGESVPEPAAPKRRRTVKKKVRHS